jgi:hypothetical protein
MIPPFFFWFKFTYEFAACSSYEIEHKEGLSPNFTSLFFLDFLLSKLFAVVTLDEMIPHV